PTFVNNNNLGVALAGLGDYLAAAKAYYKGLSYGQYEVIYENIGALTLVYGNPNTDMLYLTQTLGRFPQDYKLWIYLAIFEDKNSNNVAAKLAIAKANTYGPVPELI